MIIISKDRDYMDLLSDVSGKRVAIWTCETCARISGIGGSEMARRLASALVDDGIDVVWVGSTSASCVESRLIDSMKGLNKDVDLIISLTCDVGAMLLSNVTGIQVLNPIHTLGNGYVCRDGSIHLSNIDDVQKPASLTDPAYVKSPFV